MIVYVHAYVFNLWSPFDFVLVYMCPLETGHPCGSSSWEGADSLSFSSHGPRVANHEAM